MHSDAAFFGLTPVDDSGRMRFLVEERLARPDHRLYGGTAIAVSIAAAELVSDRSTLWMTTQFVSTAEVGTSVDVLAEVLAPGRRTNQVRVTGTTADGTVFASLGATGIPRPDGLSGEFEHVPSVSPPDESERWSSPLAGMASILGFGGSRPLPSADGFASLIEMRGAEVHAHPDPGPGRVCVWARRRDGRALTPAIVAFVADMVPLSVVHATGIPAYGTSLDNTIRVGAFDETEWALLDLRPHGAAGGYGHGVAHVWSETGHWIATASQTASMHPIPPGGPPPS